MKTTSKLTIFVLTFLALSASTFAQEPSPRERFEAATAAVKKAEAALAQAKSAEANAKALDDKEALSISQQAAAIAEKSLARAHKAQGALFTKTMNAQAKKLEWSPDEQARLNAALNKLASDGDTNATVGQIWQAWQNVLARGSGDLEREASDGDGPGFPGAGTQTRYEDCAVFALANAAGLPYGVVGTRATELIRQGEWRDATERANPQKTIEEAGLIGGEVVMLAEAFGRVEVVPMTDFAKTLKEGRPVMVNVVPEGGEGGHEVVLTKTFQHGGETWFAMMDSNQGPVRRLYLSAKELGRILQENGVAFHPETGTTPKLLR
jgi:hypothetical protein